MSSKVKKHNFEIDLMCGDSTRFDFKVEDTQKRIMLLLMHNKLMTFNQMWNKQGRSNIFAYHVKELEKKYLIVKSTEGYGLTVKGKKEVVYFERETGDNQQFPVMAVITIIVDKKDRVLMLKRGKEPFLGYWGFHGGKLKSSQYIFECARDSIMTETGLDCDVKLKGLFSSKTFNDKDFYVNHQLFIILAKNPKGKLLSESKKGMNKWVKRSEIEKLKILPNIPVLLEIADGKNFRWVEADRIQSQDSFQDMLVKKDIII